MHSILTDNLNLFIKEERFKFCVNRTCLQIPVEDMNIMGASNKICPNCGRKMKQQFIGLQHCKCGMSWKKDMGFFERTSDMVFALQRRNVGKKVKQIPVIRRKQ